MAPGDIIQFLILIILLMLSAFFSSAETALTTVNRMRMRTLAEDGNKRAQRVLKITDNQGKMLSAVLIGNNLVNIYASSLTTTLAGKIFGSQWIAVATGVLTLLILIFGEISPKTISTLKSEKISLAYSGVINALMWVLTPVIFVVNKIAMGFLFLIGVDPRKKEQSITEDELRTIVDVSHEEGVLEHEEHEMISNLFDFGSSQAKDVMIQRIDMTCASIDSTYDEIIDIFRAEKYTRLPIYKDSIDNVIGIINVKDLLLYSPGDDFHVSEILREPYYTYEFKKTSELMEELKKTSNNITIVLDEYGSTVGMITLEDLLEEIVGEIRDEYDEDEEDCVIKLSDTEYQLNGMTRLDDLNELLGSDYESEDYDSVSGLVIDHLDRLPHDGDEILLENARIVVEHTDKNRIDKMHLYLLLPEEAKEEAEEKSKEKENDKDK